ncbi:gem-associated protein 6 [Biomphalaria glabrata]|uniref:Gem-associated protein 6-like n=1 Tax=Biomphalaria glabrata TaxID=6526 RepID=A0A2C9JMQ5_BIOGL|nr:gem-associated protein 6-like [Biomphalaria glabrata]KAI8766533.1 gem-associated protein 6-like [Biomphalaria glabrata]KAI8794362.1 gem-associated protein 6 [Biomphalaria glabrata]
MKQDDEEGCEPDSVHPIFTKDPGDWLAFVNNQVEVTTEDDLKHSGYVYTVDPVSESIVLLNKFSAENPTNVSVKLLMGPSIKNVEIVAQGSSLDSQFFEKLFRPARGDTLTEKEIQSKFIRLQSWLEQNRIPVSVSRDVITVADALTIHPPYTPESCLGTNEIILARIQELIKNMP